MTSPRRPFVITAVVLAGVLALAACSSSSTGPKRSASSTTSSPSAPTSSGATSSSRRPGGGTTSSTDGRGGTTREGLGAPIGKQTIQGVHVTYDIAIYARGTSSTCTTDVAGPDLKALMTDNPCTANRTLGSTTVSGHRIGVAEAVLHFTGAKAAATRAATQVAILLTNSASNGVNTLLTDGSRLPSGPKGVPAKGVPANAARNAVNNGVVVTVVQAWYLTGSTPKDDPRLNETVEDISAA